jgi:hypothetical protein
VSPLHRLREVGSNEDMAADYEPGYAETIIDDDSTDEDGSEDCAPQPHHTPAQPPYEIEDPDPAQLGTEQDLAMRWHVLLVREKELGAREAAFDEAVNQFERDQIHMQLREQDLCQREMELMMERQRFEEQWWGRRVRYTRASWDWGDAMVGDMGWVD